MGVYTINGSLDANGVEMSASPTNPLPTSLINSKGDAITLRFRPGTPYALVAGVADGFLALGSANAVAILGDQIASARVRVLFGTVSSITSPTNDIPIRTLDAVRVFAVPTGATHLHYIRDSLETADVLIHVTLG